MNSEKVNIINNTKEIVFENNDIKVKEKLSLSEAIQYVNVVSTTVVNTVYTPIYQKLINIDCFITFYTDITKTSLENIYDHLYEYDDLIHNLLMSDRIDKNQYIDIQNAINDEISFRKQVLINQSNNTVADLATKLLQKEIEVQDLQKGILEQQKEINDTIPPELQKKFIEKFNNSELTSDAIVTAYLNSDWHKSMEQGIIDDKNKQIKELQKIKFPQDHKKKTVRKSNTSTNKSVNDKKTDNIIAVDFKEV
jgi:hypothetical protein